MWTMKEFEPIYQAWLESGLTIREFSKRNGYPESRFHRWQTKMRRSAALSNQGGEFVPVSINNHSGKVVVVDDNRQTDVRKTDHPLQVEHQIPMTCEISYPNGVKVKLSGPLSNEVLGQLILGK